MRRATTIPPWRWLRAAGTFLAAVVILFEQWGWVPLQRLFGVLSRLPAWAWVERRVSTLEPWQALLVIFIPTLTLLPVKLGGLWLIACGRIVTGVIVLAVAKIVGTAIVARLFMLVQPRLMALPWFARLFQRWIAWKDAVLAWVRATAAWRMVIGFKATLRQRSRG